MTGPDKIQQIKTKKLLQAWLVHSQLISSILLASVIFQLVSIACIIQSSSADGIAAVVWCLIVLGSPSIVMS